MVQIVLFPQYLLDHPRPDKGNGLRGNNFASGDCRCSFVVGVVLIAAVVIFKPISVHFDASAGHAHKQTYTQRNP